MKKVKKTILLATISLLLGTTAQAQITFDLADKKTQEETIDIDTDPIIVFKNVITNQGYDYSFEIEMIEKDIPAIPIKGIDAKSLDTLATRNFELALAAFKGAKEETDLPKLHEKLEKEIDKLDPKKHAEEIALGRAALEASVFTKTLGFALRNNQEITVTVTRKYNNGKKDTSIQWVRTFKTPAKSPWSIMYGFTYIPNVMNPVSNYYCLEDTAANTFAITRLNNQKNYFFKNVSPTLMITWTPMHQYRYTKGTRCKSFFSNHFYQLGFTAGLSMNFASETGSVTALAAPSLVIARNVSLSAGVCMTQKQVLNGKYSEGAVIAENLDFDQLHEKQFMGEWFITLAIRFEENPFKKDDDKKE